MTIYQPFIHPDQPVDPSEALTFQGGNGYNQAQTYAYRNSWSRPVFLCKVTSEAGSHFEFFEAVRGDGTPVCPSELAKNGVWVLQRWA